MIETTKQWAVGRRVRLDRLPADVAALAPMDVAESFRDLGGLALLESARPGRRSRWTYLTADPRAIDTRQEVPAAWGQTARPPAEAVFGRARRSLARLADEPPGTLESVDPSRPPFLGGLVGYLGYDLGLAFEPRRTVASDDEGMPVLHLALYDWVVAWDRATGSAWLAGRAVDDDERTLADRLDAVRERLAVVASGARAPAGHLEARRGGLAFRSDLDREAFEHRVEVVRQAIARGDIYQANLTRRLRVPFDGDPWPLYRELRTGDPSLFAAFLELPNDSAGHRRAIVSASPEPFLTVDNRGNVAADPIKGTRARGRTREQDRALARELLSSAKDRAENTMIVDVLRNDLGRVCRPGSVRVPRLCRLERTAAVQHLVSTVTGRLGRGLDSFDLLAAAFPGGSITGAPKVRAMELLEELEPVRRGPYTGALGWFGPDGAMATSILIRTFVADGRRLNLQVGGGITWRSDPSAEWEETVAKAGGPLGAIGGVEIAP